MSFDKKWPQKDSLVCGPDAKITMISGDEFEFQSKLTQLQSQGMFCILSSYNVQYIEGLGMYHSMMMFESKAIEFKMEDEY